MRTAGTRRKTNQDEHHRADTEIHQIFHNDIASVFRSGKARFHHGKARLHPKHQGSATSLTKNLSQLPIYSENMKGILAEAFWKADILKISA